ncbi:MAG: GNAT family protein [bacterium]|nr:GNAT family protein [bacterium]
MKAPILKGEKIILKPLAISQAENFLRWIKDDEVSRFLIIDGRGLTLNKEKEYIKNSLTDKSKLNWAIFTDSGEHIGSTGLHDINRKNLKAVWGIFIGDKNYWNQGLGTDVLKTVSKHCFKKLKLNRVELGVFPHNPRGKRCYEKCGFKVEGVKKQAIWKNGRFIDEIIMGITKDDYKKLINK